MSEDVVPLGASSIRARARPRAVLGVWAWESTLALVGSWPAVTLARAAYGRHPNGDAMLWDPGALPLLGMLSREANGTRAATGAATAVLVLGVLAGLIPLAAMMVSIGNATREGRRIGAARAVGGALGVSRPFGRMLLVVTIGQGLVAATAVLLDEVVESWMHASLGEALAQQLAFALAATVMLAAVALGVVHDLARAAVVRFELEAMSALTVGARTLRHAPFAVTWSRGWRTLASAAPVAAVALLADRVGGRGGIALVVLAALHQAVVLARVALHASWLAKALLRTPWLTSASATASDKSCS